MLYYCKPSILAFIYFIVLLIMPSVIRDVDFSLFRAMHTVTLLNMMICTFHDIQLLFLTFLIIDV